MPGYTGTAKLRLAMDSKEADGVCFTWDSMQSTGRSWFEANPPQAKVLVIMGNTVPDHPWLKGVPPVESLAKDDETKKLLQSVDAPASMSKPYALAPEVPAERVAALRDALGKTLADADFKADAEKASLGVSPLTGPEVGDLVNQILSLQPDQAARLKDILK